MANKFYGAIGVSGGSDGYLDDIDGGSLADLDGTVVIASTTIGGAFYNLDVDSAESEAIPTCIAADANGGNKRWILQSIAGVGAKLYESLTTNLFQISGSSGNWTMDNQYDGGTLTLQGENSGNSTLAVFDPAGAASLYYAGSKKIETRTDGVSITGNLSVTTAGEWTATQNFNETTLTDGATVNWDLAANQVCNLTIAGNRTMAAPTNNVQGATYILRVVQDGTGGRTLTWNAEFIWGAAGAPDLASAAADVTVLVFYDDGTNLHGKVFWNES